MSADFLVIGGGIAGFSAAARLSELGSVALVEAEPHLAHHASGRSAALYEPHYGLPPVVALSLASGDHFHATPGLLSPRGMMIVGGPDQAAELRQDAKVMALTPIGLDDALAIVPILNRNSVAHVAIGDHAWDIDTDLLIQSFAREARSRGATLQTGARVSAITREGTTWRAETPAGAVSGRTLVNAAGAWADEIARMAGVHPLGLTPLRRSMARIPAPGGQDVSSWPIIFGTGESWYAKPDAGALIVSPADEDPQEPHDAWADDMVLAEGLARYEAHVTEPVTRLLSSWAGLRTFAPDRVLAIGRSADDPSFFWLAGQGGYGFQTAPAASRLAADILAGRTPELPTATVAALDPARFAKP